LSEHGSPDLAWRTLKNSIYGMIEFAWPILLALFASPYIVHGLGVDAYGVLSVVGVTLGFFGFFDLGIGGAATRHIAVAYERGDAEEINHVVSTVLAFYLLVGVLGAAILGILAQPLSTQILKIPMGLQHVAQLAFYVGATGFAVAVVSGSFNAIPRAIQRYDVAAKLAIITATMNTGLTLLVLHFGGGLGWVVLAGFVMTLVTAAAGLFIARRLVPTLELRVRFDKALFKELFSFGAYFLISQLGVLVLYQADKLLIGSFLGVAAVTYYVVPGNLATKIQGLVAAATSIVFPVSSTLFESGRSDAMGRLYREGTRLVMILATAVSVPMAVYAGKFLLFWMGQDIASKSSEVMVLLVATYYVLALSSMAWGIANGSGRAKVNALFTIVIAAADVVLFLLLVKPLGLVGAGLAYLISAAVGVPILVSYIERWVIGLSGFEFIKTGWRIWLVGAVQGVLAWLSLRVVTNLWVTLILMLASFASFFVLYVAFGYLQQGDRDVIRMLLRRLRGGAPDPTAEM